MNEKCAFVVKLNIKPEHFDAYRNAMVEVIELMKREPTFLNTIIHTSLENKNTIVLYETWAESRESFLENQLPKAYREDYERKVIEWLAAPREMLFLEVNDGYYSDVFKSSLN